MGNFFDIDGRFFRALTKIADFIILNIIMIIFSIPIITIGPALSAVYYVSLKEVKDEEGYVIKGFWKAFKQNFKQGLISEIIIGAIALFLYFDVKVTYNWAMNDRSIYPKLILFLLLGFMLVAVAVIIYIFPMISKFNNTVLKFFINSLLMAMKHLPQTIIMLIITGGLTYATVMYPPIIVFTIGLCLYANSYILVRIFNIYIPKTEEQDDEFTFDESEFYKNFINQDTQDTQDAQDTQIDESSNQNASHSTEVSTSEITSDFNSDDIKKF